jgi:SRSO17 transposase
MNMAKEFDQYTAHLSEGLGHADRHAGLSGNCTGLMLPLSRKSVEPMAARVDLPSRQRTTSGTASLCGQVRVVRHGAGARLGHTFAWAG